MKNKGYIGKHRFALVRGATITISEGLMDLEEKGRWSDIRSNLRLSQQFYMSTSTCSPMGGPSARRPR